MKSIIDFLNSTGIPFEENVSGERLTSFRVGGAVRVVAKPKNPSQLKALLDRLDDEKIKNTVIGRGSNIVISDRGYDGVAVLLSEMKAWSVDSEKLHAGAGASLAAIASVAQSFGLSGLEFAHGIPGSVGGGIYMNAGAYGGEIAGVLIECECYDRQKREFVKLNNFDLGFSYRHSLLQEREELVATCATFGLVAEDENLVRDRMDALKAQRLEKQPLEYPSAGSTFKRPEGYFAAKLIDDAGLKGFSVGGAQVSEKHAGFVINRGGATCSDIVAIVEHIKTEVKEKFGVELECEIEFLE